MWKVVCRDFHYEFTNSIHQFADGDQAHTSWRHQPVCYDRGDVCIQEEPEERKCGEKAILKNEMKWWVLGMFFAKCLDRTGTKTMNKQINTWNTL